MEKQDVTFEQFMEFTLLQMQLYFKNQYYQNHSPLKRHHRLQASGHEFLKDS